MPHHTRPSAIAPLLTLLFVLFGVGSLSAEPIVSAYGGWAGSLSSDDDPALPNLPDLFVPENDSGDSRNSSPVHYGARFSYWNGDTSRWGFAGDYTHATTLARLVTPSSARTDPLALPIPSPGGPAMPLEVRDIHQAHDLMTVNGMYRWLQPGLGSSDAGHWFVPYVGLGVGVAVSPVEEGLGAIDSFEDRLAGPAAQGLVGGDVLIGGRWSMFVEYKLSWTDLTSTAANGSSLDLDAWTNHIALGLSMKF